MKYFLDNIIKSDKGKIEKVFALNHKNMTPIDIAGKHKQHEAVLLLLKFCQENFTEMVNNFGERTIGRN